MTGFYIVLAVLVLVLAGLASNRVSAVKSFLFAAFALLLTSVLTADEVLKGFSNKGIFTIAALYIVVGALKDTGSTQLLRRFLVGSPKTHAAAASRVLPVTTVLSAFVNNTPVVAMFTTLSQSLAKRFPVQLSQLLLPVSYASILGGICTLIGTSTNLVVDGMLQAQGFSGFGLFEPGLIGLPIAIAGLAYLFFSSRRILPVREGSMQQFDHVREYLVEMQIQPGSELCRKAIHDAGLRNLPGLFLVEIERDGQVLSAVRPRTVLEAGDRLVFAGSPESVLELRNIHGLTIANDQRFKLDGKRSDRRLFEAVLSPSNAMIGQTIKEARFRHRYSAVVLSVSRHGERLKGKLGQIVLEAGDTLLIEAQTGFLMRYRNSRDFLLVSRLSDTDHADESKAKLALAIFVAMVVSSATGLTGIFEASVAAVAFMLLTRCISFEDAGKSVDYPVLLVIACAFALGTAVQKVGLADAIANSLLSIVSTPWGALIAIYIATALLTEMVTNNAAAIVMLPIALSTASSLDVNYQPFAITVMIAASASFLTPTGYQTNLMVMGPGGYKFIDYVRFGAPLSIIVAVMAVTLIPLIWVF